MALTQRQVIRKAVTQAKGMKANTSAYVKGVSYKGHPVVVQNTSRAGHGFSSAVVTHSGTIGGGTVTHTVSGGKLMHTSRSRDNDSRIHGAKTTLKVKSTGKTATKKGSTGRSSG